MANTYKVLGQSNPVAITATTLYTVPVGKSAVISTISVCNTVGTAGTFRIAVRIGGSALTTSQYVVYDLSIAGNATYSFTQGLTLAATDVLTVYASSANMAFSVFGTEIA